MRNRRPACFAKKQTTPTVEEARSSRKGPGSRVARPYTSNLRFRATWSCDWNPESRSNAVESAGIKYRAVQHETSQGFIHEATLDRLPP